MGIAVLGERVDPGASGIAEAEKLGDLVIGFAGGVVDGAADECVVPGAVGRAREIEMSVAAGDDQGESWFGGWSGEVETWGGGRGSVFD